MNTHTDPLIDMLIAGDFVSEKKMQSLLKEATEKELPYTDLLIHKGILTDEHLGQIQAELHGWHFINLRNEGVSANIIQHIPQEMARKNLAIAFEENDTHIKVALNNPENMQLVHTLKKKMHKDVQIFYATISDIKGQFYLYKSDIREEFRELLSKHKQKTTYDDSLIIQIVHMILTRGYEHGASDIHLEPGEEKSMLRFRIDGVMQEMLDIPKEFHEGIISRIKVISRLRTDEHQIPQDGKISFSVEGDSFDIRVSIVPTTKGENAVLRLLSDKAHHFTLDDLSLTEKDFEILQKSIKNPWGMILVTGPTGSGKTTSLYALLKILNTPDVNIATIEDPVENNIEGVTQIQVNNKAQLTFASGLRSVVRQDPDIIMVGEIRDQETANIAVNSAMTGHLVLSTLHTNDAATTVPRLLDMGIEPFLLASTVNVIVAQRLVRRICPKCIESYETTREELEKKFPPQTLKILLKNKKKTEKIALYRGKGCHLCNQTGYHGRMGVFEILEMQDNVRQLIMQNKDADTIKEEAIKNGMTTMSQDGYQKVLNGMTTLEEILRVVKT